MQDIESLLHQTAKKILPTLTPAQLQKRLLRQQNLLARPPREWCLAIRANDHRLTDHLFADNQILLTPHLLRLLCDPIELPAPGLLHDRVARLVGRLPNNLHRARFKNILASTYRPNLAGRHGPPVPLLSSPQDLDPNAPLFQLPSHHWSWTAQYLTSRIPENFQQQIKRIPLHRPPTPPATDNGQLTTDNSKPSRTLPPPPPDYVSYKWKNNQYLGYDWKNPAAAQRHHRHQLQLQKARDRARKSRANNPRPTPCTTPTPASHRFICPQCQKPTTKLYLPLPPKNVAHLALLSTRSSKLPSNSELRTENSELHPETSTTTDNGQLTTDTPQSAIHTPQSEIPQHSGLSTQHSPIFACRHCHKIRHLSLTESNAWNHLVAHLSGGLLFGREVPKPADFTPLRKKPFRHRFHANPAPRRNAVLRRLLNGWTIRQIAKDLNLKPADVHNHMHRLFKLNNVTSRRQLAAKHKSRHPQPLTHLQRAAHLRAKILPLLLQNKSHSQIAARLHLTPAAVARHTLRLYKLHNIKNVKGNTTKARHALAQTLNLPYPTLARKHST